MMGRTALYQVSRFYELQDVPVLFGTEACAEDLNDCALGRTLDRLFDAGPKKVLGAASLRSVLREDVAFRVVHADTTSWTLKGVFETSAERDEALWVTRGYSRDHRPDLKQFNHGLVVNI